MMEDDMPARYYIGWSVGAWDCDTRRKKRDTIVILDDNLQIIGTPWRGNLRTVINDAPSTSEWIRLLFANCRIDKIDYNPVVTLAIDIPLGYPDEFVRLVNDRIAMGWVGGGRSNPYLFRATERWLSTMGFSPLSTIKDISGSQITKGMHALARFTPQCESCGVWTDGEFLHAIEAYPSACRRSDIITTLLAPFPSFDHDDKDDALICALLAYLFAEQRNDLYEPHHDIPASEGWIWMPR